MSRSIASALVALAIGGLVACAQTGPREGIRVNVKQDLLEVSASQDDWWLAHGWSVVPVARVGDMPQEELRQLLVEHFAFTLLLDGAAVTSDRVVFWIWEEAPEGARWVIEWEYVVPLTPGIHVLRGTWSILDLPCAYLPVEECVDGPSTGDAGFDIVEPFVIEGGLLRGTQQHTLTLVVLP